MQQKAFALRNIIQCSAFILALTLPGMAAMAQQKDPVAERMLLYQRSYGGWPKVVNDHKVVYDQPLDAGTEAIARAGINTDDATIDNKATTREIVYLLKAYGATQNKDYLDAARRGIDYLLKAQYANGGWPQYYPNKKLYRAEITYNDDAMINVLNLLQDVAEQKDDAAALGQGYAKKAAAAVEKGITCILKTQVTIKGRLTAWAAQYNERSLQPAKARAFELPALASSESASIVVFLMRQQSPSKEIQQAVQAAAAWFEEVKIKGYRTDIISAPDQPSGKDRVLVADSSSTIWARFYDLETLKPQFVGRDSVPKKTLAEIENERRAGYAWYGNWGTKVEKELAKWKKKNNIPEN